MQPQREYPTSFEAIFRENHTENTVAGNEIFWEIPFSPATGRVISTFGIRHLNTDKYTLAASGGIIGPNAILFYKYKPEDVRRDITCVPYAWQSDASLPVDTREPYQIIRPFSNTCFGKMRYEWLHRRVIQTNDDGLSPIYMRYANVLLMAAEAINEIDGPAAAAPYLKQIKDRAYPDHPAIVDAEMSTATVSKEAFFNDVVDERAKELAGEMYRKEDLIRWNMLTSKMEENREELQKLHQREAPYDDVNLYVYWKRASDDVSLIFWGLNRGELGAPPVDPATYTRVGWTLTSATDNYQYWERLYVRDPGMQPYWPIWQYILDASNGVIVNDPIFQD